MATNRRRKKKKNNKKFIIFGIELLVLVALLLGLFIYSKLNKIDTSGQKFKQEEVNIDLNTETAQVLKGYTNIALFGLDNRSNGDYQEGNSDSIMIASINNDTKEVKLLSVYRDTYLNTYGNTYNKINSAYANGGAKNAVAALNKNLNLNITDYITVDFNAVVDAVDLLGGIQLTLTDEEVKIMNEHYMDEINKVTGHSSKKIAKGGTYTVDGVQALAYCRIRYTAGDDFKRTERQRTVLSEMISKAQGSSLTTIAKFIDDMFGEINTNYTSKDLLSLAGSVLSYKLVDSQGWPFELATGNFGNKGSLVVPCDLQTNVEELHEYLFNEKNEVSNTVSGISKEILNYTGCTPAKASRKVNPLTGTTNTEAAGSTSTDSSTTTSGGSSSNTTTTKSGQ